MHIDHMIYGSIYALEKIIEGCERETESQYLKGYDDGKKMMAELALGWFKEIQEKLGGEDSAHIG